MATDSTELTFVRCPSCRSLVPAVSSRCRMCGAGLDSNDDMSAEEPVTADAPGIAQAAAPSSADSAVSAGDEDFDDPLGDYLQDFEDSDEDGGEDDSEGGEEEAVAVAAYDEEISHEEELADASDQEEYSAAFSYEEPPVQPKSPPVLKVESGKKNGGGLSFRKERAEASQSEETSSPKVARTVKSASQRAPSAVPPAPEYLAQQAVERAVTMTSPVREDSPRNRGETRSPGSSQRDRTARGVDTRGQETRVERPARREQSSSASAHGARTADHEGRLYGWLVSYSNPDGTALELREGKFFVTGSSLKSNDLVIDHPSVSTPHALVAVSAERGLVVQDLMSDRGVFLRGYEDDAYRKEEETVRLEHGDWIRFGEEEFLVTLIPLPARR